MRHEAELRLAMEERDAAIELAKTLKEHLTKLSEKLSKRSRSGGAYFGPAAIPVFLKGGDILGEIVVSGQDTVGEIRERIVSELLPAGSNPSDGKGIRLMFNTLSANDDDEVVSDFFEGSGEHSMSVY